MVRSFHGAALRHNSQPLPTAQRARVLLACGCRPLPALTNSVVAGALDGSLSSGSVDEDVGPATCQLMSSNCFAWCGEDWTPSSNTASVVGCNTVQLFVTIKYCCTVEPLLCFLSFQEVALSQTCRAQQPKPHYSNAVSAAIVLTKELNKNEYRVSTRVSKYSHLLN